MKCVIVIQDLFMQVQGAFGPFDTVPEAEQWAKENVNDEICVVHICELNLRAEELAS